MTSQEPNLRVALVGGAHIHTPSFIDALNQREDVSVAAAWDHDAARAAKCAEGLGCPAVLDIGEIWEDTSIGAVVICSETDRHLELVTAAAAAKKHMFVEKPLGFSARDSFQMAAAIEEAGVHFTTGYFLRTTPVYLFLKKQVESGAFGTITRVRGSNCHNGSLGGWFDTDYRWMADPKVAGCGAFGDLGTHSLDLLMWLFGGIDAVTADIRVITGRYGDCDETGEAMVKFESGVIGTLAGGWVDVENPVNLLISGTEGHAAIIGGELFFHSSNVDGADGGKPWTDLPAATPRPLDQLLDAVQGKPYDALVPPAEAAARVAVMESAYKAAATQTWVKVPRE